MPFCANCGWKYGGEPRFCRECGRSLFRARPSGVAIAPLHPPTRLEVWRPRLIVGALALLAGAAFLDARLASSTTGLGNFPVDEAWSRLVYARSLSGDLKLEFNPGQPPAALGSPLWVLLLALLVKTFGSLGVSVVALAKAGSLLASAAAAVLAMELTAALGGGRAIRLAVGLLAALHPAFGFAAASGLEVTLFAALALGACLAFLRREGLVCGVLVALALLTRPEGLALALALPLALLVPHLPAARVPDPAALLARLSAARAARAEARAAAAAAAPPSESDEPAAADAAPPAAASEDADVELPDIPDIDQLEAEEQEAEEAPVGAPAGSGVGAAERASDAVAASGAERADRAVRGVPRLDLAAIRAAATPGLLRAAAVAIAPVLVALVLWIVLDRLGGSTLPRGLSVARAMRGGLPLPALGALWSGYLAPASGFLGGFWLAGLAALIAGAVAIWRFADRRATALVLFPVLLALGVSSIAPLGRGDWGFADRRLLDPILPFLVIWFVVGVAWLWAEGTSWLRARMPVGDPRRRAGSLGLVATALVASVAPLGSLAALWGTMPAEYAGTSAARAQTDFAAARVVRDEPNPAASVATLQPGVIRYVSRHPVIDLGGLQTPGLAGKPLLEALGESEADLAVVPKTQTFDSWPRAAIEEELEPPPGSSDPPLGVFRLLPRPTLAPKDAVYALPAKWLRRVDYFDVADEAAEATHAYNANDVRGVVHRQLRITPDAALEDDGRIVAGSEQFDVVAQPGRDLLLARRYESASPGVFRVTFDGQPVGEWRPRPGKYLMAEDAIRVPAGMVRRQRSTVRLEPVGSTPTTVYGYWIFAEAT